MLPYTFSSTDSNNNLIIAVDSDEPNIFEDWTDTEEIPDFEDMDDREEDLL